jgi:hypothetical protein
MTVLTVVCLLGGCWSDRASPTAAARQINRENLFAELRPVKLAGCTFERFGDSGDGGYVMCGNLLDRATAIYSYGIAGTDNWGCALSARLRSPVHEYDCFNSDRPHCPAGAQPIFHDECVGPSKKTEDGRLFDSVQSHIERNGDAGKRLIMKMDVEGSEWPSFLAMPESALNQIDQLSVEFHNLDRAEFVEVVQKLKRVFHVANIHYNNWVCDPAAAPFPSLAFEVLFVNRSLAAIDPAGEAQFPNPLDAPNNQKVADCQLATTESKSPR